LKHKIRVTLTCSKPLFKNVVSPRHVRLTAEEEGPIHMKISRKAREFNKTRKRREMISKHEALSLDYYCRAEEQIAEMRMRGEPVDTSILFSSGKKERYLQALRLYSCIGLTAKELYEKRFSWLCQPGEKEDFRLKTISMFLCRLYKNGLAGRRRCDWSKAYRYFITENGEKKLAYYKKTSDRKTDFLTKKKKMQINRAVLKDLETCFLLVTPLLKKNDQYATNNYVIYIFYTLFLFKKIIDFQEAFLEKDEEKNLSIIDEINNELRTFNSLQKVLLTHQIEKWRDKI